MVDAGLAWQTGVWDRMADVYRREVDPRFAPIVESVLSFADVRPGQRVLDLGTGTGAVARRAAARVGAKGSVMAVDVSPRMLEVARVLAESEGRTGIAFVPGRAEEIPAPDGSFDCVVASLSLMYAIDRVAAAHELARVLRPDGSFVAAAWAGAESCDIVRFQQTAGRFAPAPPVPGVGPGALAEPTPFVAQLGGAGIEARVERETHGFTFPTFDSAWEVLAGVTAAALSPEQREAARRAVQDAMWPDPARPRQFRNETLFIVGRRR